MTEPSPDQPTVRLSTPEGTEHAVVRVPTFDRPACRSRQRPTAEAVGASVAGRPARFQDR